MAVTIADVKNVYPQVSGKPTDPQYTAALETAQLIVAEQMTNITGCTMTADRLDKITIYLAAHFLVPTANTAEDLPAGGLKSSKIGESSESYFGPSGDVSGYESTRWGQLATALDLCGILAGSTANNGLKAQFRVVGGERS